MSEEPKIEEVVEVEGSDELGKRTRLKAVLTAECPLCGREVERELYNQYLSYPCVNSKVNPFFTCSPEDDPSVEHGHFSWEKDVVLRAQLEVHEDTVKITDTWDLSDEEKQILRDKGYEV